jgi:hypothetical protein
MISLHPVLERKTDRWRLADYFRIADHPPRDLEA